MKSVILTILLIQSFSHLIAQNWIYQVRTDDPLLIQSRDDFISHLELYKCDEGMIFLSIYKHNLSKESAIEDSIYLYSHLYEVSDSLDLVWEFYPFQFKCGNVDGIWVDGSCDVYVRTVPYIFFEFQKMTDPLILKEYEEKLIGSPLLSIHHILIEGEIVETFVSQNKSTREK